MDSCVKGIEILLSVSSFPDQATLSKPSLRLETIMPKSPFPMENPNEPDRPGLARIYFSQAASACIICRLAMEDKPAADLLHGVKDHCPAKLGARTAQACRRLHIILPRRSRPCDSQEHDGKFIAAWRWGVSPICAA